MRPGIRVVLLLAAVTVLVGCTARSAAYEGSCAQQTQQFLDDIHSLVLEELRPVIDQGFDSERPANVIAQIEKLDATVSQIDTPVCNPKTQAVKDTLRLYMLESKNYFSTVAGRAVYGEGPVQAQLSKMYEAGTAFEVAFANVRK